jgi:hypothetical protein
MTETEMTADDRPIEGAVERLARDDLERKKFLKMAGKRMGAGGAFDKPLSKKQVLAAAGPLIK